VVNEIAFLKAKCGCTTKAPRHKANANGSPSVLPLRLSLSALRVLLFKSGLRISTTVSIRI